MVTDVHKNKFIRKTKFRFMTKIISGLDSGHATFVEVTLTLLRKKNKKRPLKSCLNLLKATGNG